MSPPIPGAPGSAQFPTATVIPPPPPPPSGLHSGAPYYDEAAANPFAVAAIGEAPNPVVTDATDASVPQKSPPVVKVLIPEAEFIASLPKREVTVQVRIPNDASQMAWNFYGQAVSLVLDVSSTIMQVKQSVSTIHLNGMPVNKIQLKNDAGFLNNNNQTLAALNIGPTGTLELLPKVRGGRK
jgi:hypothetical protein